MKLSLQMNKSMQTVDPGDQALSSNKETLNNGFSKSPITQT
jgi:hypothetical protein